MDVHVYANEKIIKREKEKKNYHVVINTAKLLFDVKNFHATFVIEKLLTEFCLEFIFSFEFEIQDEFEILSEKSEFAFKIFPRSQRFSNQLNNFDDEPLQILLKIILE